MKDLFKAVNNAWYEQYGTVNANIVDSEKVITRKDLQECCDAIGIEFDCMNY